MIPTDPSLLQAASGSLGCAAISCRDAGFQLDEASGIARRLGGDDESLVERQATSVVDPARPGPGDIKQESASERLCSASVEQKDRQA